MNSENIQNRNTQNISGDTAPSVGVGYLIIKAVTGSGALPVAGATVLVRNYAEGGDADSGDLITSMKTDINGNTERLALPAPSKALSQKPGVIRPYAMYTVDVTADGYGGQQFIGVPIFDGITSVQPVELNSLPANKHYDNFNPYDDSYFESQSPEL